MTSRRGRRWLGAMTQAVSRERSSSGASLQAAKRKPESDLGLPLPQICCVYWRSQAIPERAVCRVKNWAFVSPSFSVSARFDARSMALAFLFFTLNLN